MRQKPAIIGLKELRRNTERYIAAVKRGRSFTVVRRSTPIFHLTPVDPWGDEGSWETIADFRKLDPRGVTLAALRRALKKRRG